MTPLEDGGFSFCRHAAVGQDDLVYMLVSSCEWRIFAPSIASRISQKRLDAIWQKVPLTSLLQKKRLHLMVHLQISAHDLHSVLQIRMFSFRKAQVGVM
jgi:hypothetical protein